MVSESGFALDLFHGRGFPVINSMCHSQSGLHLRRGHRNLTKSLFLSINLNFGIRLFTPRRSQKQTLMSSSPHTTIRCQRPPLTATAAAVANLPSPYAQGASAPLILLCNFSLPSFSPSLCSQISETSMEVHSWAPEANEEIPKINDAGPRGVEKLYFQVNNLFKCSQHKNTEPLSHYVLV